MSSTNVAARQLEELKSSLLALTAREFENLAAALISEFQGVGIAVAKSGFQHGGDGGPAGRQGRRFRIETKRYAENTALSDRELQGEVMDALARDPALESWLLVATRDVVEQTELALARIGREIGVPVVIVDWKEGGFPALAALCCAAPEVLRTFVSDAAAQLAEALAPASTIAADRLRREMSEWGAGYVAMREASHLYLDELWSDPRRAQARFAQNTAGGASQRRVGRPVASAALDAWWGGPASKDAPAIAHGQGGMGKTWASMAWLVEHRDDLPIILSVPSSALNASDRMSVEGARKLLAEALREVTGHRQDLDHWLRRTERLLKRPDAEGPAIVLLMDGMDQLPGAPWLNLLKAFQDGEFAGRVRVIATVRRHYFETTLRSARGLVVPAHPIAIDPFSDSELDGVLGLAKIDREQLSLDFLELARTPRLFDLVVQLKEDLQGPERVTLHRLLWGYGRDTAGVRTGQSFSEQDWREWLADVARRQRDGMRTYSLRDLGQTADRPGLTPEAVQARLSDIIDGNLTEHAAGGYVFRADVVFHALGLTLVEVLAGSPDFATAEQRLGEWLDPMGGLDERAEVLRAGVSIAVAQGDAMGPAGQALVAAWLQSQNIPPGHQRDLRAQAQELVPALLEAIARSSDYAQASARESAVDALGSLPRTAGPALSAIIERATAWLSLVPRGVARRAGSEEAERARRDWFMRRLGRDEPGRITVLGRTLELVDHDTDVLNAVVPTLLEGYPLESAAELFATAAIHGAIAGSIDAWRDLKWLALLNVVDPAATGAALRLVAQDLMSRGVEDGVHQQLGRRASALVLWLTGEEADDVRAGEVDPGLDSWRTYQGDYLADPARAFHRLERRHLAEVLSRGDVPIVRRAARAASLLVDPGSIDTGTFPGELSALASEIDVASTRSSMGRGSEDHALEEALTAFARLAPQALAGLLQRRFLGSTQLAAGQQYWRAIATSEQFVLSAGRDVVAARAFRALPLDSRRSERGYAATLLLAVEIFELKVADQVDAILEADLPWVLDVLLAALHPLSQADAEAAITRHPRLEGKKRDALLVLIAGSIGDSVALWRWVKAIADDEDADLRGFAWRALYLAAPGRRARELLEADWCWRPDAPEGVNHYGSLALIRGATSLPFEALVARLAPWLVLQAARERKPSQAEVRTAVDVFDAALRGARAEAPDYGASLIVRHGEAEQAGLALEIRPLETSLEGLDGLKEALDLDLNAQAHERARATALERVKAARAAGAQLLFARIDPADLAVALSSAPDLVQLWLEGMEGSTQEFRRRIALAKSTYLALCEALLAAGEPRGAELWRALAADQSSRHVDQRKIDELTNIVFRVDGDLVLPLRQDLLELTLARTDLALFEVALVAQLHDRGAWLEGQITEDSKAKELWRRKRAIVLSGFVGSGSLEEPEAFPAGELQSNTAGLRQMAAERRWRDAAARAWWAKYWETSDRAEAQSAWILFMACADRRAWSWMKTPTKANHPLARLKLAHLEMNEQALGRAMERNEKSLKDKFLGRDLGRSISPWRR